MIFNIIIKSRNTSHKNERGMWCYQPTRIGSCDYVRNVSNGALGNSILILFYWGR